MKYLIFSCLLATCFIVSAQDWLTKYNQSLDYYNNFQLEEARNAGESALQSYKTNATEAHKNLAVILRQLSLICYEQSDISAGISYAKEEVEVLQSISANTDMNYANALHNLGIMRSARSEYKIAEQLFMVAIDLAKQFNDDSSLDLAIMKGNFGVAIFNIGSRDDEAETLLFESLETMGQYEEIPIDYYNILYNYSSLKANNGSFEEALSGFLEMEDYYAYDAPNYDYGSMLIKVGDVLDNLGRFKEAIEKYKKANNTFEQLNETSSSEYAIAQNNLSIDLQKIGDFAGAEVLVMKVLKQREEAKNDNPEAYCITATNYANMLIRNGLFQEAKNLLQEVLDTYDEFNLIKDLTYINTLESMSQVDLLKGDLLVSLIRVDEAIKISDEKNIQSKIHSLYNQKAKSLAKLGKYKEARKFAEKSYDSARKIYSESSVQLNYIQNSLADIYAQLGQYGLAQELYEKALAGFEMSLGNQHPEYATTASNYSSLLQLTGNYSTAETLLLKAVEIKRTTFGEENLDYLTTYENLGILYQSLAAYTNALSILEEVKELKEGLLENDDPSLAFTYNNLGVVKKQLAEYPEAESYFKKARGIYETSLGKSHVFYASTLDNLALLYQKMGNTKSAKPLFIEAINIYEGTLGKMSPDYASALGNLASIYQMDDDLEKAKELLEEVRSIDEQILGKSHPLFSKTLHNLASLYEKTGDLDKSRKLYEESLQIEKQIFGDNHPVYASTLFNLASLEQELENYDQAKNYFNKVVDIRRNILGNNHPDYVFSVYGLASVQHRTGEFELAKSNYLTVIRKYVQIIEDYFPSLSESEKSAFYSRIQPVFIAFMDFAIEYVILDKGTKQDREEMLAQVFDLQLSTKALLLNASNKVRNRIMNSGDEELVGAFNQWIAMKENIVKSLSLSKEEIQKNNIDIASMESEANEMEKQLSLNSSLFAQGFEKQKVTWTDVRDALQTNEAAIEIIRVKKKLKRDSILYASLILESHADAIPKLVLASNGDFIEGKGFKTYKNSILFKVKDTRSYNIFWKDIDEVLGPKDVLYLSADGAYNKVNIATLFDQANDQYIVDKYNIRLLSNTRELVESDVKSSEQSNAELFGYPKYNIAKPLLTAEVTSFQEAGMRFGFGENVSELPGTLEEINNITGIMTEKSWEFSKYLELEATEESVKKLNNPKILHIATHGFFLEDLQVDDDDEDAHSSQSARFNPLLRSGLLFAGAENTIRNEDIPGEEDGILTAYEAMNLNLDNTDLVIMSACETGLGEVKNGEGVYGLQRSFIVAGAQNLVMSLWKVNDETTQMLMSNFYGYWFSGDSKINAFNKAIQDVKSNYPEPYYWGAFVMLGK